MNNEKVYYELKMYLDFLGVEYINKIPPKIYNSLLTKANNYINSNPESVINIESFKSNGKKALSKDARIILFNFYYNYFSESDDERKELLEILQKNDKIYTQAKNNYSVDIFNKNQNINFEIDDIDKETLDILYKRSKLINNLLD